MKISSSGYKIVPAFNAVITHCKVLKVTVADVRRLLALMLSVALRL